VDETYTETALHFDAAALPSLLERYLPPGPLAFADLGCGDGPLFAALERGGFISPERPAYAVDLAPVRLVRVAVRFPWITTVAPRAFPRSLTTPRFRLTMVMEHFPTKVPVCRDQRVLRPEGARLRRRSRSPGLVPAQRDGESVSIPRTREHTDIETVRELVRRRASRACSRAAPPLFRCSIRSSSGSTPLRRPVNSPDAAPSNSAPKVPIPGYYSLELVLER
jgi:hypothetical protein